jgi:hypothetical protein
MTLFFKDEVDRADQQPESGEVVPFEAEVLKKDERKNGKYDKGDDFLDHFQLNEGKGAAFLVEADAVGRHLKTVFKKSDAPADEDNDKEGGVPVRVLPKKTQVPIPGHGHKRVGQDEQADSRQD